MMRSWALFAGVVLLLSFWIPVCAQGPPQFDAATIKLDPTITGPYLIGLKGGPGTDDPGRVTWQKATLQQLIATAFDVDAKNISGPSWISPPTTQLYTFQATVPPNTSKEDFNLMFRAFLTEQFKLSLHHENKMFPAYELVVAPGGAKLTPSPADAPKDRITFYGNLKKDPEGFPILPPGHGLAQAGNLKDLKAVYVTFQQYTISDFAQYLIGRVTPPGERTYYVIDKTGLTGAYDFKLKFEGESTPTLGPAIQAALAAQSVDQSQEDSGLPTIFKAVEQQLGLKLVKAKEIPRDTIVIDHAERIPVGN